MNQLLKNVFAGGLIFCVVLQVLHAADSAPAGMARVPDGIWRPLMRSAGEPETIAVKSFWLDRLPVSNREFLKFVRKNDAWQRSHVKPVFADGFYLKNWESDLLPGKNVNLDAPVTFVSWFAARAYARWAGKRLPNIAEWEHAAAASSDRPDGDNDADFKRQVLSWYSSPSPSEIPTRGLKAPNLWGIRDLHGLVWEWVSDFNAATLTGDSRNDSALDRDRFCGSGSIGAKDVQNFPAFMRYGFRSSLKAPYCVHNLGFRCAKDL
jgi:formylglycine-generating enzyme required for sulfatase activity